MQIYTEAFPVDWHPIPNPPNDRKISDIALAGSGLLAAIDTGSKTVLKYEETAEQNGTWTDIGLPPLNDYPPIRVGIGPMGVIWLVTRNGQIYYFSNEDGWKILRHKGVVAKDIGIASDGTVWAVFFHGGETYIRRRVAGKWKTVPYDTDLITPERIDAGPAGSAWVCGKDGEIAKIGADGSTVKYPGSNTEVAIAQDVGVGGDGSVWHIGMENDRLYRLKGKEWEEPTPDARGKSISIAPTGRAAHANGSGEVYVGPILGQVPPHKIHIHAVQCIAPSNGVATGGVVEWINAAISGAFGVFATLVTVVGSGVATVVTAGAAAPVTVAQSLGAPFTFLWFFGMAEGVLHAFERGAKSVGQLLDDEVYVKFQGEKIWPEDDRFVRINSGEFRWLHRTITRVPGHGYTVDLMEWDFLPDGDDSLGSFEIGPADVYGLAQIYLPCDQEGSAYIFYVSATDDRDSDTILRDDMRLKLSANT